MAEENYRLDPEEQQILESFNRGEWVSKGENPDKYKDAAKQTLVSSVVHKILSGQLKEI